MKILNQIKNFKKDFFTINQTELTPFSKFLMSLFFFTALLLIAVGIDSSIHQTTPPYKKYGYRCLHFAATKHLKLSDFQQQKHFNDDSFGTAPECKALQKAYRTITNNHHIQSEIQQIRLLEQKKNRITQQIRSLNQSYSNMLLEKISNHPKEKSILQAHADDVLKKLSKLRAEESELARRISRKKNIMNYPEIQKFTLLLNQQANLIKQNYEKAKRYYRLKISAQVFAFLIPIWLLFYALYRYLDKHRKFIFAKLSFYVASAAALYGLIELIQLIYSIIPKLFLAKLIAFFTSHNMIIVLNILGILLFLGIFGLIIHKVQKNHEKNRARKDTRVLNVKRGLCFNCASPRKESDTYCAFCGENLKTTCTSCQKPIYRYTLFCTACGSKQE
jgi:hypothetical protein